MHGAVQEEDAADLETGIPDLAGEIYSRNVRACKLGREGEESFKSYQRAIEKFKLTKVK